MPVINVNVDKLDLDLDNPRYEQQGSQREALEMMLTSEPKKTQALAQHIIDNGLNPTDLITVIPGTGDRFIVVEGNRRSAVLRALRKPALLDSLPQTSALSGMVKKMRVLAVQAKELDLVNIDVALFDSREEANVWIALKHTGENGGAGTVPWDGLQTARFRKGDAATSLLEYGKQQGWFTEQDINGNRAFPVSTLARLIGDPDVRAVLGLELRHGQLSSTVPPAELAKGVKRVVGDLLGDHWTVTKLKSKKDREGYVAQLPASARPNLKKSGESWPVGHDANQSKPANAAGPAKVTSKPTSRLRTTLIPPSFIASINSPRINDIYRDLKRISVHTHPNACAVLLRVLIELSVDELIESKAVTVETQAPKRSNPSLADKINASVQWMRDNRMLTKQAAEGVKKHGAADDSAAANSPTASVTTLHAFMHNRYASPIPTELNAMWSNGIEAFMGSLLKAIK
jgi:hypothetical protein